MKKELIKTVDVIDGARTTAALSAALDSARLGRPVRVAKIPRP